jgi:FKBP-type peptidyl-prolyl cis-trans isomerase SlyD
VVEHNDLPITYIHGQPTEIFHQVVEALEGHRRGDEISVDLQPEDAFGAHDPNLTFTDDIDNAPPELRYVGAELEAQNDSGDIRQFRVTRIEEGKITVDANHPLAGEAITFCVKVLEVRDPTSQELAGQSQTVH